MPNSQEPSNNSFLSRINQIHRIDTYFFKNHSNIVFTSSPRHFSEDIHLLSTNMCEVHEKAIKETITYLSYTNLII